MPENSIMLSENFRETVHSFYKNSKKINNINFPNYNVHLDKVIEATSKRLTFNNSYKSNYQPVCRFLNSCIKNTPKKYKVIAEATQKIKELLYWKVNDNYKNVYPDHFFQNESFVEIIGPSGLLICPNIRVGFLLLGKDVFYPSHNHEALELYTIISGSSLWQINDEKFAKKSPGDQIFHDLWMPHSMKTDGQPVLALFSWSGAIFKEAVPIN